VTGDGALLNLPPHSVLTVQKASTVITTYSRIMSTVPPPASNTTHTSALIRQVLGYVYLPTTDI
jgi:hypothetical protein